MTDSNILYNVRVFKNEKLKIAHVAINLINAKTANLVGRYSRMTWNMKVGNNQSPTNGAFCDGFIYMLANSNLNDWNEEIVYKNISRQEAARYKKELSEELIKNQYSINGMTSTGCSPHSKDNEYPKFIDKLTINPKTLTLKKFKKFCEKCTIGLNISNDDFNKIFVACYKRIVYSANDQMTRFDVWKEYQVYKK